MRHKDDLSTEQGSSPYIFNNVVVITYQNAAFPSFQIKHTILTSRSEPGIDERMQLPEFCQQSGLVHTYISLKQVFLFILFKQSCKDRDVMLLCNADEPQDAGSFRNQFSKVQHFFFGKMAGKCVSGDRTFMKGDSPGALFGCSFSQPVNYG